MFMNTCGRKCLHSDYEQAASVYEHVHEHVYEHMCGYVCGYVYEHVYEQCLLIMLILLSHSGLEAMFLTLFTLLLP